jgi:Zn-dependent protease with chaperone function
VMRAVLLPLLPAAAFLTTGRSTAGQLIQRTPPVACVAAAEPQYRTVQLIDSLEAADFQHPTDRDATAALKMFGPVEWLVRQGFKALNIDDASFLDNIATGVRVGPDQLPELHTDLVEACRLLNVPVAPELYVRQAALPNAYTLAVQGRRPYIVVTTALLDLLEPKEVQAVIAHELGHLKCEHGLFLLLSNLLTTVVFGGSALGAALQSSVLSWQRAAELSCDRAALLVVQEPRVVQAVVMKLVGGSRRFGGALNVEAFVAQAAEYDEVSGGSRTGKMVRRQQLERATHPLPILRARELERWAASPEYARLLARGTPLKVPVAPDARAAAAPVA